MLRVPGSVGGIVHFGTSVGRREAPVHAGLGEVAALFAGVDKSARKGGTMGRVVELDPVADFATTEVLTVVVLQRHLAGTHQLMSENRLSQFRIVLAAALVAAAPLPLLAQSVPAGAIDGVFERWTSTQSPGCAVGVSRGGLPIVQRAYGMADLEHDVANDAGNDLRGRLGVEAVHGGRGRAALAGWRPRLNDHIRKYVPEMPGLRHADPIRHLLTHTSGLRDWGSVADIAGWPRGTRTHTHDARDRHPEPAARAQLHTRARSTRTATPATTCWR